MSDSPLILVVGATGQQGGAVVNSLLDKGLKVRAVTRNPESAKAKALSARGVHVVKGDMDRPSTLTEAAKDVDAAFFVVTPFEAGGVEKEAEQGIATVNAFEAANVPHIVFSSVAQANTNTGIPHFESKYKVEQHLASSGIPYTITAPVAFSDNVWAPWNVSDTKLGIVRMPMPSSTKLQVISVRDIGHVNAEILVRPADFCGRRLDIAADNISGAEQAVILTKASGKQFKYVEEDIDNVRKTMGEDMAIMFEWLIRTGYDTDREALRKEFPSVQWQSFEQWANEQDWEKNLA